MPAQTAIGVMLNGESRSIADDATVAGLLEDMGLDPSSPKGIAVAVNDEVIPKSDWGTHVLENGDRVEVITARQGG